MASFKDYQAVKTARIDIFGGEYLTVRQVSSAEFLAFALPYHRERLELEAAGKLTEAEESRLNLSSAFALVDGWSFDDELTLENFVEFLQCPQLSGIASSIIRQIDTAASNQDLFVKKKSLSSSTGSAENGISTSQRAKKASRPAVKA